MNSFDDFIQLLNDVLDCAETEKRLISDGKSLWSLDQVCQVVIPEIRDLFDGANRGMVFYKYGKKQRLLESSYLIMDSLEDLAQTTLGSSILTLQRFYNTL